MNHGFLPVCAAAPQIALARPEENASRIAAAAKDASARGVKLLLLPELCLTGKTCGDLLKDASLLCAAERAAGRILAETSALDLLLLFGAPVLLGTRVYNCAVCAKGGRLLALVAKTHLSAEERRVFSPAPEKTACRWAGKDTILGAGLLLRCETMPSLCISAELGEDGDAPVPPAAAAAARGATLLCRLTADAFPESSVKYLAARSRQYRAAMLLASAGDGESTGEAVYLGACGAAELGEDLPAETQLDLDAVVCSRISGDFCFAQDEADAVFSLETTQAALTRTYPRLPFVSDCDAEATLRAQSFALARRLERACAKTAVVGLSGGLDSTLTLLCACRAMDLAGRSRKDVFAVTMPCFGTTDRTRTNAEKLAQACGVTLRTVPIAESVRRHFADIGLPESDRSTTYENAQARERTQVLMDLANLTGGIVCGTGDLSEIALGWSTYNGDHMSMYNPNASVPKTLVRALVRAEAENLGGEAGAVLADILATPVSPELLPPENGAIAQVTEDLVGPYELHDFFLYYGIYRGFSPEKVRYLAEITFCGTYDRATVTRWLRTFYRRYFAQSFKRACAPDGARVTALSLSPRTAKHLPSDASAAEWLDFED